MPPKYLRMMTTTFYSSEMQFLFWKYIETEGVKRIIVWGLGREVCGSVSLSLDPATGAATELCLNWGEGGPC